jgi:hypothetical protein
MKKSGLVRMEVSLEVDNLVPFYYLSTSEIWADKRGGLWWVWPDKRGSTLPKFIHYDPLTCLSTSRETSILTRPLFFILEGMILSKGDYCCNIYFTQVSQQRAICINKLE